ncbi:MAG: hypothetical protein IKQ71_00400 [Lachnospiraceae bacterium]|nr:hypothetical protein [Lachnospiraceae bacterium]
MKEIDEEVVDDFSPIVDRKNAIKKPDWKKASVEEKMIYAKELRKIYAIVPEKSLASTFKGEKYKNVNLGKGKNVLSMDRTGGYTVAMLLLLNEKDEDGNPKYSLDDLFDNSKYKKEKQAKFEEIMEKQTKDGPEERKFFAEEIYKGIKNAAKLTDNIFKELDTDDEYFEYTETYQKLGALGFIAFDAWQELWRFEEEATDYITKTEPEIKDYKAAHEYSKNLVGPFSFWNTRTGYVIDNHFSFKEKGDMHEGHYLNGAIQTRFMKHTINKYKEKGQGQSFVDYCYRNNIMDAGSGFGGVVQDFCIAMSTSPKFTQSFDELAYDGKLFKNIEIIHDGGMQYEIKNLPKLDQKNEVFILPDAPHKELESNVKKANKKAAVKNDVVKKKAKDEDIIIAPKKKNNTVSYDRYMELHTVEGGNDPKTITEMEKAFCKILAGFTLKKLGKDFSLSRVRNVAKHIDDIYQIHDFVEHNKLEAAVKNKDAAIKLGEEIRCRLFSVNPGDYDKYKEDMKILADNMVSEKGHSTEYKNLVESIKAAANLNTEGMTDREKASAFRQANVDLVYAATQYIKGKKKRRRTEEGRDCFDNTMDALAIVSKYSPKRQGEYLNIRIGGIIGDIMNKRGGYVPELNLQSFETKYGAKRALARNTQKLEAKNKGKNKVPQNNNITK